MSLQINEVHGEVTVSKRVTENEEGTGVMEVGWGGDIGSAATCGDT